MSALTNKAHTPTQSREHREHRRYRDAERESNGGGGGSYQLPGIFAVIITRNMPMDTLKSLLAVVIATLLGLGSALSYLQLFLPTKF